MAALLAPSTPEPPVQPPPEVILAETDACNCWQFIKNRYIPDLPNTSSLIPSVDAQIGAVALFVYPNGVNHYAYVTGLSEGHLTVREANYSKCKIGTRVIPLVDPALRGFWGKLTSTE